MVRRVMKSGTAHYYYLTRTSGKIPLGSDLAVAKLRWADLEAQGSILADDQFPGASRRYRREVLPGKSPKTQQEYSAALDRLDAAFEKFRLPQIRPLHCRQYLDRRSAKVAGNREMAVFSALFNWAREVGITDAPNPAAGVKRNTEGRREVYVTDEQFAAVWKQAGPELQDALDLARLTGQRPADVLKMRLSDITDGHLWVRQNKTKARLGIAIVGELADVVERCRNRPRKATGLYLVQTNTGQRMTYAMLRNRFEEARQKAGESWQFRDLRPKAATDLDDVRAAQELLGHRSETTTASIYRRLRGNKVQPVKSRPKTGS